MTLPYPHEVETGELTSRPQAPRAPIDIEARMKDAIQVQGTGLHVFGVPMQVEPPDSAGDIASQLRVAVTEHFQQRVSAPDEDIWALFASQAHDQLQGRTTVDASTVRVLRLTIDSL